MERRKVLVIDGNITVHFTSIKVEDILKNGHNTYWIYKGNDLLFSVWAKQYDIKYSFTSEEKTVFFNLINKEGDN